MDVLGFFNWWAVLASTALAFVLGGIWYGLLFEQAWMRELGKTEDELPPSAAPFVISFFTAFITAMTLAWLVYALNVVGWLGGASVGLVTGIGFIAASMASDSAFCRFSLRLFLIQSGYRVLYSVLMGAVLGAWQ